MSHHNECKKNHTKYDTINILHAIPLRSTPTQPSLTTPVRRELAALGWPSRFPAPLRSLLIYILLFPGTEVTYSSCLEYFLPFFWQSSVSINKKRKISNKKNSGGGGRPGHWLLRREHRLALDQRGRLDIKPDIYLSFHKQKILWFFSTQGYPTSVLEDLAKPVAAETGATMLARWTSTSSWSSLSSLSSSTS